MQGRVGGNILRLPSTENTWKETRTTEVGGCHWTREWGSAECYSLATVSTFEEESDDFLRIVQLLEYFSFQASYSWKIIEILYPLLLFRFYLRTYKFSKRTNINSVSWNLIRICSQISSTFTLINVLSYLYDMRMISIIKSLIWFVQLT